jgi:hypothetical protein
VLFIAFVFQFVDRLSKFSVVLLPVCLFMITYRPRRVLVRMCTAGSGQTKTGVVFTRCAAMHRTRPC